MERTPLLAKTSQLNEGARLQQHADVDEECGHHLGAVPGAATAPPPAAPPPPLPPAQDAPTNDNGENHGHDGGNHDDSAVASGESPSQLTMTQSSIKSGKSGKSSRRRKKERSSGDAASTKSGRSGRTAKSDRTKKKKAKKDGPQKSACHLLFDSVRYLAMLASTMMFAMQIVPLVILGYESTWLQIAVRCYLAIFCISFILTESRIPILRKYNDINWILRGFLYSFIGLIGMEQDLAVKVEDIAAGTISVLGPDYGTLFAALFMSITTWIMIGVGILYTALGLLCMQGWYERLDETHREKVKEWKRKKKRDDGFRKQKEEQKKYEKDRSEGRGEWYDDLE